MTGPNYTQSHWRTHLFYVRWWRWLTKPRDAKWVLLLAIAVGVWLPHLSTLAALMGF